MSTRVVLGLVLAFGLAVRGFGAAASAPPPSPASPTPPQRTLAVVVVDSLHHSGGAFDDFNWIAEEFEKAFAQRKWPVKVTFERFAANNDPHDLELTIFYRGIMNEFGEQVWRGWVVLNDRGTKHDFGIVEFRYWPRPIELRDDVIEKMFFGAGNVVAKQIEPYVNPSPTATKS